MATWLAAVKMRPQFTSAVVCVNPSERVSEARVVGALSLLYVFRMLGLFMVFPVMMLYGMQYHGASPFLLGIALGGYGLTQAIFQIPMGLLSDFWGRKPVILMGLAVFVLGSLIAALSDHVWGLILGRALQGAGAIASAVMALVGDLTSEQNRTKAMATIGASIGLSFSLAMVLGPVLAGFGGLSIIFWFSAILALIGMVILYKLVPTPARLSHTIDSVAVPSFVGGVLRNTDLVRLNVGIFSLHFVLTATFVVIPFVLNDYGVNQQSHWHYYLPIMLVAFVIMLPFMIVAERKRKIRMVFTAAVALLLLTELAMTLASDLWHWIAGLLLFFVAFNLLEATLPSLVSKQAPAGRKGTAMGVYSTCQFLGAAAGGMLGGWFYQYKGIASVLILCAAVVGIWLLFASRMRQPRYLSNVCVPFAQQPSEASLRNQVPGVVEVFWIKEQALLYLKVDDALFERGALNQFLQQP